jgi:hypothetical protein
VLLLVAAVAVAGCGRETAAAGEPEGGRAEVEDAAPVAGPAAGSAAAASSAARAEGTDHDSPAPAEPDHDLPASIYYDLTSFDWYRRGEPLLHEGQRYLPGKVEPAAGRRFKYEGAYDGVDYYVLRDEQEPHHTIYVPVYSGYWLSFALEAAAPADH